MDCIAHAPPMSRGVEYPTHGSLGTKGEMAWIGARRTCGVPPRARWTVTSVRPHLDAHTRTPSVGGLPGDGSTELPIPAYDRRTPLPRGTVASTNEESSIGSAAGTSSSVDGEGAYVARSRDGYLCRVDVLRDNRRTRGNTSRRAAAPASHEPSGSGAAGLAPLRGARFTPNTGSDADRTSIHAIHPFHVKHPETSGPDRHRRDSCVSRGTSGSGASRKGICGRHLSHGEHPEVGRTGPASRRSPHRSCVEYPEAGRTGPAPTPITCFK